MAAFVGSGAGPALPHQAAHSPSVLVLFAPLDVRSIPHVSHTSSLEAALMVPMTPIVCFLVFVYVVRLCFLHVYSLLLLRMLRESVSGQPGDLAPVVFLPPPVFVHATTVSSC